MKGIGVAIRGVLSYFIVYNRGRMTATWPRLLPAGGRLVSALRQAPLLSLFSKIVSRLLRATAIK